MALILALVWACIATMLAVYYFVLVCQVIGALEATRKELTKRIQQQANLQQTRNPLAN